MKNPKTSYPVIIFVVLVILLFGFLVRVSLNLSRSRRDFQNEMAQRLDLEEQVSRIEKDRQLLSWELQSVRAQLTATAEEAKKMSEALEAKKRDAASVREEPQDVGPDARTPSSDPIV